MIIDYDGKLAPKDKKKLVDKLRKHSLSGSYEILKRNIFTPMKVYWESPDHSSEDSTVGQALAYSNDGTVWQFLKVVWIRVRYSFSMGDVADYMEIFHTTLVKKLLDDMEKPLESSKGQDVLKTSSAVLKLPESVIKVNPFSETKHKIGFDDRKGTLYVHGYEIRIVKQRMRPTRERKIMKYIFIESGKDLVYPFDYMDIAEFEDCKSDGINYHKIFTNLNKKIVEDTNNKIKDFFIFNSVDDGTVRINNDFLKV